MAENVHILQEAVNKFKEERALKSFSGRNPELGKMMSCCVCQERHRSSVVCIPRYFKLSNGFRHSKGRRNPHPNKKNLQLIQRTQELYSKYAVRLSPSEAMKCARAEAGRTLRAERKANRK